MWAELNQISSTNSRVIPSKIMQSAKDIADILYNIEISVSEDKISINYLHNDSVVKLWFCEFWINWNTLLVSEFYTANLNWIDTIEKENINTPWINEIDILEEPIKNIWKEMFRNLLKLSIDRKIQAIYLIYNQQNNADIFYRKMKDYFPKYIDSIYELIPGSLVFQLRNKFINLS